MQLRQRPVVLNPVSLIGGVIASFSLAIILVLLVLGATGIIANPYTGVLTFLVGPMVLAVGLILVPVGILRERRRLASKGVVAETFPVLDLNRPEQRKTVTLFGAVTVGLLLLMAVTTYGAAQFMETREFCGDVCHQVMAPEATGHQASPHARVSCVSCHIGPGAPWLVKSKISGTRQVFKTLTDGYTRPVEVPIQDLRPSRDTCEECHWPERFYGDMYRNVVHYDQDQMNSAHEQPMVFRVGGSALGQGIHWHTTAKLSYLPLNDSRSEIGWLRVEKPDGSVDEYTLPGQESQVTPDRTKSDQRFMDCIDCHNRAAHDFASVDNEIDNAMTQGLISTKVPFIKQQAMQAIGTVGEKVSNQQYQDTLKRIDGILDYYRTQQAAAFSQNGPWITQAVAQIKTTYQGAVFPGMGVTPSTYTNWLGHDGCFRCHGKLVGSSGSNKGKTVSADCQTCHYTPAPAPPAPAGAAQPAPGAAPAVAPTAPPAAASAAPLKAAAGPPAIPHDLQGRNACSTCHTVGGPGVGVPGGTGIPASHQGRPDATCTSCHKPA